MAALPAASACSHDIVIPPKSGDAGPQFATHLRILAFAGMTSEADVRLHVEHGTDESPLRRGIHRILREIDVADLYRQLGIADRRLQPWKEIAGHRCAAGADDWHRTGEAR